MDVTAVREARGGVDWEAIAIWLVAVGWMAAVWGWAAYACWVAAS